LDNEILSGADGFNDNGLRRIGVNDLDQVCRGKKFVESRIRRNDSGLLLEPLREKAAKQRMLEDRFVAPDLRIEISDHQQFRERIEP
jgi:hypothetical protein